MNINTSSLNLDSQISAYADSVSSGLQINSLNCLSVVTKAVQMALKNMELSEKELINWKKELISQNSKVSNSEIEKTFQNKIGAFVKTIEEGIKKNNTTPKIVEFISDTLCNFHKEFPENDALEFVLIGYLFTRLDSPIISIQKTELDKFKSLHGNKAQMSSFLADKIREAIKYQGKICKRISQGDTKDFYENPTGGKPIKVEWTDLVIQKKLWSSKSKN